MVRRRSPVGIHDPAKAAAQIQESLSHLTGRFEQMAGDLDARLGRIEKDVAEGSLGQERLRSEMAEGRRDAGELRDGLSQLRQQFEKTQAEQAGRVAASAAQGAAQGAIESAAPVFAAARDSKSSGLVERFGVLGMIVLALVVLFDRGPNWVRVIDAFWTMMKGLNP